MKELITYSPEFQRLLDATKSKNPREQFFLAKFYLKSKNEDTLKKAFALFKKLANQYHDYTIVQTDSQYMLGICYENGYGIQKSYQRAIRWYKMVGKNISSDLTNNPDPEGDAFNESVEDILEDRSDIIEALDEYIFGEITPESVEIATEAAEQGDLEAQRYLMDVYHLGPKPFKEDERLYAYWTERAAENGDAEAMSTIGGMYYCGRGVKQDYKKALYWLEKAVEQGAEHAAGSIGEYYELQKRYKEAVKWYRKFAESKIEWRNNRLGWKSLI